MDGALAWIGQFAEWIGSFVPRLRIVRSTHGAIKFVKGEPKVVLGPKLLVFWPLVTEFIEYPIVRQGVSLREQTMVTTDDRTIVAGGMLIYTVDDLQLLIGQTYSADQTIKDIALTALHDVLCEMTWEELKREQQRGTLVTKLKNEAQKGLKDYGVRVVKFSLTDLSPCRVYRLVETSAKGEE